MKTEIDNSIKLRNLSSSPLNGMKNNANGAPKRPKINEPHIGQPAPNIPAVKPIKPIVFVFNPIFLHDLNLYINKEIYNPNNREIRVNIKNVSIVYHSPFMIIKIIRL